MAFNIRLTITSVQGGEGVAADDALQEEAMPTEGLQENAVKIPNDSLPSETSFIASRNNNCYNNQIAEASNQLPHSASRNQRILKFNQLVGSSMALKKKT